MQTITNTWSSEGRIDAVSEKLDTIEKRHEVFVKKALPKLKKAYPKHVVCRGTKTTSHDLDKYEHLNSRTHIAHLNIIFLGLHCEGMSWSET
jgi:hypothetical protein